MSQASTREGLYKYKGKSRTVDTRVKDKQIQSKRRRDEVVSNRRGVLCDVNEDEMTMEEKRGKKKDLLSSKLSIRVNKRKEELLKWKEERDTRRKKEKLEKKPAFMPAGGTLSTKPNHSVINSSLLQSMCQPNLTITATIKEPQVVERVVRKSTRIASKSQITQSSTVLSKSKSTKAIPPSHKGERSKKTCSANIKPVTSSKSRSKNTSRVTKVSPPTDSLINASYSKGDLTSESNDCHVRVADKENLVTSTRTDDVITTAWIPGATNSTVQSTRFSGVVPDFDKAFTKQCFSPFKFGTSTFGDGDKIKFTFRKELPPKEVPKLLPEVIKELPVERDDSYMGESNQEVNTKKEEVNPKVDQEINQEVDQEVNGELDEEAPLYTGLSDDSIEAINNTVAHNNDYTNQQLLLEEEEGNQGDRLTLLTPPPVNVTPPLVRDEINFASPQLNDREEKGHGDICNSKEVTSTSKGHTSVDLSEALKNDLKPYYERHSEVTLRFTNLCQVWNEKIELLESQDVRPSDEVMDDIRTTVCSAQLLMRQKLKQYIDLVKLAEDPTAEHKTELDDLQGFWDMVYFQVEKIDSKFNTFQEMEANNWLAPLPTAATSKPRRSKRRASEVASTKLTSSSKSAPPPAPPTERQLAARAKREAARSKLRQLKLAARNEGRVNNDKEEKEEEREVTESEAKTPKKETSQVSEVVDLISFSPAPSSPSVARTPRSRSSRKKKKQSLSTELQSMILTSGEEGEGRGEEMTGAFVTKLVPINVTKKLMSKYDSDIIMSPARRSIRLLDDRERRQSTLTNSQ